MKNRLANLLRTLTAGLWADRSTLTKAGEAELREHNYVLREQLRNARAELNAKAAKEATLQQEREAAIASWDEERERAIREAKRVMALNRRVQGLAFYLADLPTTADEIEWTRDDAKALAAFLDAPTGKKLARHLTNRLADYDRAAVLYATAADAPLRLKRAHGFRDCRGELLRLSAAGPSPAQHEPEETALPPELEHLRA